MTLLETPVAGRDLERQDLPRVSCIMPTRDRRTFVAQSIRYFLRQDYPDVELIVIDDGYDPIADLIPDGARISYEHLSSPLSIGAKRNLACRQASGDIIAHWDDDDWCAPDRLRRQVTALMSADADACGLSEVLHYRPLRGDTWLYRGATDAGPRVAGCSIVYRRSAWEQAGFPDTNLGEDSAFLGRLPPERLVALPDRSLLVAVVHGGNVSALPLGTPQWEPRPLDEVADVLGADRPFYTQLRGGTARASAQRKSTNEITLAAAFDVFSGYGTIAEYLALSLARAGADVRPVPLALSADGLSDELMAMTQASGTGGRDGVTIYHAWIRRDIEPFRDGRDLFVSTMWEGNRLPASWVPMIRGARALIVPSIFVADSCRASGVSCPIVVVPQGVDPDVYHWEPRREHEGVRSLIVAPVDERKHTLLAIAAWKAAFAGDADARLVIKTTYGYHNYVPDDPRITYVDRIEMTRGIADWYRGADVLLALGNEGFGLPLVEGMATGLPVIALNAEGQTDVVREAHELVLAVPAAGLEPHTDHIVGPGGYRSVPDFDAVVQHLRWVTDHRAEAAEMGRAASVWAIEHRNIWNMGAGVLDVVRHATSMRVGHVRPRTFWVTSVGTACGVADYTARLRRNLPFVGLIARTPEVIGGIIHIQHEPALMDDRGLEQFTAVARDRGAIVAVTEHSVLEWASPWERNARALVAATMAGTALLRERLPDVHVVHIPLGCETWHFPRKVGRGRTIGVFGFPGAHKGIGRLAEALRHVRRCEVLMLADDPGGRTPLPAWPPDVPVTWERDWLTLEAVAARLASEADVLVFHYDDVGHRSASSAVMLGLSTAVPVLTSTTNWFADLGQAVHRTGTDVESLADGLEQLLEDDELRDVTIAAARDYCQANSWNRIAARHVELWNALEAS